MKTMDDLLKQALAPKDEPDFWLNQNILAQLKGVTHMKKFKRKKAATVVCACAIALAVSSISVYAAWKYLMPDQVIEEMGRQYEQSYWELGDLKEAFSADNAIYINETQSCGGFDVTLLGVTSGKNLTRYKYIADGVEQEDRTYLLFAIEHESLELSSSQDFEGYFEVFPVVMGYDYETYRGVFEHAVGGREFKKDGILYYMYECGNLEKFADHDIYMCVSDDLGLTEYSYLYDNDKNMIARNEEYEGLNALFSLPLDPSKADPKAVEEAIRESEEARKRAREEEERKAKLPLTESEKAMQEAFEFCDQITPENIDDYATLLTDEIEFKNKTFIPDAQGRVSLNVSYEYKKIKHSSYAKLPLAHMFPNGETKYITNTGIDNGNIETLLVELYTLNEDGTVTLQVYKPNF